MYALLITINSLQGFLYQQQTITLILILTNFVILPEGHQHCPCFCGFLSEHRFKNLANIKKQEEKKGVVTGQGKIRLPSFLPSFLQNYNTFFICRLYILRFPILLRKTNKVSLFSRLIFCPHISYFILNDYSKLIPTLKLTYLSS